MNAKQREILEQIRLRAKSLELNLQKEVVFNDVKEYKKVSQELSTIEEISNEFSIFLDIEKELKDAYDNLNDPELHDLLKVEIEELKQKLDDKEATIQKLLIPKDEHDEKNVIFEIRGAAGGSEANIFAGDLFEMYKRFAESMNYKIEILELSPAENGGFSNISFIVKGKNAYSVFKYESGIHRVQRVPKTESQGRIHTSTATVAVLPEANDVDVEILNSDLRIDTYKSSGAGGQHVNTTDSAVRITHIPTGVTVSSQDGRSQHSNKEKAMTLLRSTLLENEIKKEQEKYSSRRKLAVGTGARSEKIRTYNYPQNRITDHRISFTTNKLDQIMLGKLGEIVDSLSSFDQSEKLLELEGD